MVTSNGANTVTKPEKMASSIAVVVFAATVTVRVTEPASLCSTSSWRPGVRSATSTGVTPRDLPSTRTRAPGGVEVTCMMPTGFFAIAADGLAGGAVRTGSAGTAGSASQSRGPATNAIATSAAAIAPRVSQRRVAGSRVTGRRAGAAGDGGGRLGAGTFGANTGGSGTGGSNTGGSEGVADGGGGKHGPSKARAAG